MSQEETCRECGETWKSHTLIHDERGNFGSQCGRNKRKGIDPFMQLWRDHEVLKELFDKCEANNSATLAKLKHEHQTEIAGRQKQLDDLKAAAQSAEARVRGFDDAMKAELDRLREKLEKAHKADLEAHLAAKDTAHEEARTQWERALSDLQDQYNALNKRLDAANAQASADADKVAKLDANLSAARLGFDTERSALEQRYKKLCDEHANEVKARTMAEEARDEAKTAQTEAERKLRRALTGQELAETEAKRVAQENQEFRTMLRRYENLHGPLPAEEAVVDESKVVPDATPELPEAPSDEPAPVEVVAVPQDERPVDDEGFSELLASLRVQPPIDASAYEEEAFAPDPGTDPSIELGSLHGSMIVEHDDYHNDGDDAPPCASYGGCPNHPAWILKIQFEGDEDAIEMLVCDEHEKDRGGLLMALADRHGITLESTGDLDGRFLPINNEQEDSNADE